MKESIAHLLGLQLASLLVVDSARDLEALGGPCVELLQGELQGDLHCTWGPLLAAPKSTTPEQEVSTGAPYFCLLINWD